MGWASQVNANFPPSSASEEPPGKPVTSAGRVIVGGADGAATASDPGSEGTGLDYGRQHPNEPAASRREAAATKWDPDCPGIPFPLLNDEFNGTSNDSKWTPVNMGTTTYDVGTSTRDS